ncbi:MAG: SPOR domain-containing protein [Acidobacteria bacterium]|nr:SPOR domain-containing protein [Acidobacteriota bacterium]
MAARDDGEFELILGNKQLLSVLFIVIVLLGVFFTMGFLAGRSTGAGTTVAQNKQADKLPLSVDAPNPQKETIPPASDADMAEKPAEKAPVEQPVERQPEPAPQRQVEPPPAPKKETPKKEAAKKEAAKPEPVRAAQGGYTQTPPGGTYLQAAATRRAEAESMLGAIAGKTGLRGYVTPSPKSSELFRVIIGPLGSNESVANARVKLIELGVKSPYVVKY